MEDWYKILGVKPTASVAEIKHAYRAKAKKLHPDTAKGADNKASEEAFRILVRAYEILTDVRQRSIFDTSFIYNSRYSHGSRSEDTFDYRRWLLSRTDDESRSKLVLWDLLHHREDDAVTEYKNLCIQKMGFSLSRWFTRENFMDYGFILAEELVLRAEYYDAVILLEQIIKMEYSYSYFRHFFPEVMDLARNVLCKHLEGSISDDLALEAWETALELKFDRPTDAVLLVKIASAYFRMSDMYTAKITLNEALKLDKSVFIPDCCRSIL